MGATEFEIKKHQPYIVDMENCEVLTFQTIPLELDYKPETSWNVVMSPGRNNPLYQYSGSEDTLTFNLTWYADEESRQDVLRQCKYMEGLSKNNSYDEKPHRIKFIFGDLFKDSEWIVFSAPYKLSLFNREKGMLPTFAIQEITLKRIMTSNRTTNQIRKIDT